MICFVYQIVFGIPCKGDPRWRSIRNGGDLFHNCKSLGIQAFLRIENILWQSEHLPLEKIKGFFEQIVQDIAPLKDYAEEVLDKNFEKRDKKLTTENKLTLDLLGTEALDVWRQQHRFLPIILDQCENRRQKIIAIAASISFMRTQEFIGFCHKSDHSGRNTKTRCDYFIELMRTDRMLIKDFMPDMV